MPIPSERLGADSLAALLGPEIGPLFHDGFVRSCERYEEYVFRLTLGVFDALGLPAIFTRPATLGEAIEGARLDPGTARVPLDWTLRALASRGVLDVTPADEPRYRLIGALPELRPEEIREAQERDERSALPAFEIATIAAEHYPAVLRGETEGERVLFAADRIGAWCDYFSNDDSFYAVSNALGAIACSAVWTEGGGAILELGGGLGSGAEALLSRLEAAGRASSVTSYRFTELAVPFLRRGQRSLTARFPAFPFAFARLDMNEPFADAGVAPGAFRLVYGVNTLHVANDLAFTLGEIRAALSPGGLLVLSECVRPHSGQPIYVEFVFNLLRAFREPRLDPVWRPNGGFLTPEQWSGALSTHGFRDVHLMPDVAALRDREPRLVVAAIVATKA